MNKKGVTILELLISITIISAIVLLLLKVMLSLEKINNDQSYASSDEIKRAEIIKNIQSDFLSLKLNGLTIQEDKSTTINLSFEDTDKTLIIEDNKLTYDNESYSLKSENATYSLCPTYHYLDLDDNYYLVTLRIAVLINNQNTTLNDDITLTYIGLKNEAMNYLTSYNCLN